MQMHYFSVVRPGSCNPGVAWRALMLGWALWLAWSLVAWLRWGWKAFHAEALWHKKWTQLGSV